MNDTIQAASHIAGLVDLAIGIPYAIFGTSTISVNGLPVPAWASRTARLLAPVVVLGVAWIAQSVADETVTSPPT